MFKRFTTWLKNRRHFIFAWYTKDSEETQEPERSLRELAPEERAKLVEAIENLPINSADREAVTATLDKTFDRWQKSPNNTDNSVVIISSPVTAVSRILGEALPEWAEQKQIPLKILPLTRRPEAIAEIKQKLEHSLDRNCTQFSSETQTSEIVVIPNLSWYFLRSLEGLEGIDCLQSLLCQDFQHRFWVIGTGRVAWEYLDSICSLRAYCGEISSLPNISAEQLERWLNPIVDELEIVFERPRLEKQILEGDKDNKTNYFERLAAISQGVSTVAVQGFLKSIVSEIAEAENQNSDRKNLVAETPKLAKLPSLDNDDRYLLYSLLLHDNLTLSALAKSLGDEEGEVRAKVRVLRRKGVIEQQDNILKINPIHYPKLKQELAVNNFVVDES